MAQLWNHCQTLVVMVEKMHCQNTRVMTPLSYKTWENWLQFMLITGVFETCHIER